MEIADLRSELKTEIAELRLAEIAGLKGEFAEMGIKIADMKTDLVFRLGSIIVLCTGILGFLIKVK